MRVDRSMTPHRVRFQGQTFFFCSDGCREQSDSTPEHHARRAAANARWAAAQPAEAAGMTQRTSYSDTTILPARSVPGTDWLKAARRARALSWLSLVWMGAEGTIAIVAGVIARSIALVGSGSTLGTPG